MGSIFNHLLLCMSLQSIYLHIAGLLTDAQLQEIIIFSKQAAYIDGRLTAFDSARDVKNNAQMNMQSQEYGAIQQILLNAMNQNAMFRNSVFPKNVYPFLISRYTTGMNYGWHVDSPLMGNMMRTDVAMTIFLNDPDEYEGGELELQTATGNILYKLNKGDAICYPCNQLHRVREVTHGERHVAVTWIESMIKNADQRKVLCELQHVINNIKKTNSQDENAHLLQQNHSNLLRMWCE